MDVLVLRSVKNASLEDAFSVCMNTTYADRVLGHLSDKGDYCGACDEECIRCRRQYDLDFSKQLAGVLEFPAALPGIIEHPEEFLPDHVPDHDVLLALAVNEEILTAFIQRFRPARGIIVPIEESDWISPNAILRITEVCEKRGVDVSFPKPFCSFDPPEGTVLHEFKTTFRIGRPEIEFTVRDGVVVEANVRCSAPCGATYYMARWLKGMPADENLVFAVEKLLSGYPCTAGRTVDAEFKDSIMHQACKIQSQIVNCDAFGSVTFSP